MQFTKFVTFSGSGPDRVPAEQHDSELQGWPRPTEFSWLGSERLGKSCSIIPQ